MTKRDRILQGNDLFDLDLEVMQIALLELFEKLRVLVGESPDLTGPGVKAASTCRHLWDPSHRLDHRSTHAAHLRPRWQNRTARKVSSECSFARQERSCCGLDRTIGLTRSPNRSIRRSRDEQS
ncbi:hypothetical protein PC129_g4364 [Phytophthora cactorum]|uniref:Uncharacterized protein n=1 Tax=Phytophthora cactorum TaxID=29920 RepID=A0A329RK20_9STRA|nr:hypothetical protein Pcac1_g24285 [Phytophthora cactorum]KAG2816802.1 hypothetical protein PC111_g12987 [Phytophthora cactorum]KAG2818560.1 hypothetical protein PC112_g12573 [Phytophthora cactorum]KAG2854810.1 hypothetical protein PC113_g12980 [Phytophthora cactorum]KAG2913381.1 hypothetical protein PC115_g12067 [Phytophthora cactorum]